MSNFANAKFAINLNKQSDKDTPLFDSLVRFPILFGNGTGFGISPDADNFGDVVDPIMENSKVQILGAGMGGAVSVPTDANFLGLILGTMLGTINTTNPDTGVYQHVITPSNSLTPNFHSGLYSDGTCDNALIGLVPGQIGFGANHEERRINAAVGFTGIRMQDNDGTNSGTVTVDNTTEIWTRAGHGYTDGEAVTLSNSGGALPTGAATATQYYVEVINANTFYLHTTYYGAISHTSSTRLAVSTNGTGTHTVTKVIVAYPDQEEITPFHFTNPQASLTFNIDGAGAVDYTQYWAGFQYGLQDVVNAELRAGSNTFRAIERATRQQSLSIELDYTDTTFKDIIRNYQKTTSPPKFEIVWTLKGAIIGSTTYNYSVSAHFYNCNLLDHDYTRSREIGKQILPFSVNHDLDEGKSVEWTIINETDGYLT